MAAPAIRTRSRTRIRTRMSCRTRTYLWTLSQPILLRPLRSPAVMAPLPQGAACKRGRTATPPHPPPACSAQGAAAAGTTTQRTWGWPPASSWLPSSPASGQGGRSTLLRRADSTIASGFHYFLFLAWFIIIQIVVKIVMHGHNGNIWCMMVHGECKYIFLTIKLSS